MWRREFVLALDILLRHGVSLFILGIRKLLLILFYGGLFALLPESLPATGLRLRVSPVFRSSLRLKYRGESCASNVQIADFLVQSAQEEVNDDLDYGDRIFADGYVCQDAGTGKPDTVLPDSTWNWGYQSASQYDAENQMLTFRKYVQVRQENLERIGGKMGAERESDRADEHCGLEFAVEIPLAEVFSGACSFSAGWQWVPAWREHSEFCSFRQDCFYTSSVYDAEDHYVYATYGAELPPPGHAGCYEGPFADPPSPGTLIANRPSSVQRILGDSSQILANEAVSFRNQVHLQVDCEQQEFWFGPVFRWMPVPWLSCSISPRFNLMYSAVELKREEKLWQIAANGGREQRGHWRHQRDGQRLLPGTSLSATLEGTWESGFFAGLNLAASWYPEDLELRAGPGKVTIRPGTLCAGAIFGYRF